MWPNLQETVDLVIFTEEMVKEKLYFFMQCNCNCTIGVIVTLCYFKRTIYCNIYQYLDRRFTLCSVDPENKQAILDKDKSQDNFKTIYINVFKTLKNPWNNPNNGVNGSY